MATSGASKSFSDGTACTYGTITAHAIRMRCNSGSNQGFIWENQSETPLMGLSGGTGNLYLKGYLERSAHNQGFLCGSYNSVGDNSHKTNPIYTIGANYKPTDTSISGMYGIGYSHENATFIPAGTNWGMYVAAGGSVGSFLSGGSYNSYVSGDFGIGTTAPTKKLDVNGNAVIGDNGYEMFIGNVGHGSYAGISHKDRANQNDYALIQHNDGTTILNAKSNKNLYFKKGNGTVGYFNTSNHLVITNSCGIGNVNPSYKLDVNGDTRCRNNLYITTNGANIRSANQTYGTYTKIASSGI